VQTLTANTLSATLSGPTSDLAKVKSVIAEVPVGGRTSSFQEQVILMPLDSADQIVKNVQVSPTMVSASASIRKIPPQKKVTVVAKISGHPASGYAVGNIVVHPDSLRVTGSKSSLAGLSVLYTQPISVAGDTSSVSTPIGLAFPSGVSGVRLQNVTVSVTISAAG
jgi:YbbR domain-containing protein